MLDGKDTPAVYRPSTRTFYFRHTLTQGNADSASTWGDPSWLPVSGPTGIVTLPSGIETVEQFLSNLGAASRSGNGPWLYSRIHPQALEVLGSAECNAYWNEWFLGVDDALNVLKSKSAPTLWETDAYGPVLHFPNTYTILTDQTWLGITERNTWHLGVVGNRLNWYPETCAE